MDKYAKFGANSLNLEDGLKQGAYKGKVWGEVGDGIHQTTRYGESANEARKSSLGVVFRNWHPGPLGLQYIADLTSFLLLRATVKALDEIIADPKAAKAKWPKAPFPMSGIPATSIGDDDPLMKKTW